MKKKKKKKSLQTDNESDLDEIFHDLKKKNPKMEAPKLRLWAKLIESGRYDSYEDPPAIPLITGGPLPGKPKKESLSDAVSGAATAKSFSNRKHSLTTKLMIPVFPKSHH